MISILLSGIILTNNATQPAPQLTQQPQMQHINIVVQQQVVEQLTQQASPPPPRA